MARSVTSVTTHAQYGQDVLAHYLLQKHFRGEYKRGYQGRYIDVGACWPIRVSNTFYFYERGWRGLCMDANPAAAAEFAIERPEDRFVSEGVSDSEGEIVLYTYTNQQWNSFDPARRKQLAANFVAEVAVKVRPLSAIIDEYLPADGLPIDLMSIDTEGHEMQVLESLDFERHRPRLVLLESILPVVDALRDPIVTYLAERQYLLASHTGHDAFFLDEQAIQAASSA